MPRVRLISTALAFLSTGALTTAISAQAPAAIVAQPPWHASSIGTSSTTARDEFYQGLRDLDAERFIVAREHFNNTVATDPNFALGQLYAALNGAITGIRNLLVNRNSVHVRQTRSWRRHAEIGSPV